MEGANISDFLRRAEALERAWLKLPTEVAAIAVAFSKDRFREQNWWDTSKEKWKPRKARRKGGRKKSQTLLVDTGRLKRSIRKISATQNLIVIGTDVPYAAIHNNGGTIKQTVTVKAFAKREHTRKAYSRNVRGRTQHVAEQTVQTHTVGSHIRKMNLTIPARPFLGQSAELEKRILKHIENAFAEALK